MTADIPRLIMFVERERAAPVNFVGYIGFNNSSELHAGIDSRSLDGDYVRAAL